PGLRALDPPYSDRPGEDVDVTDAHRRAAGRDQVAPPRQPGKDIGERRVVELARRAGPAGEQLALHLAILRPELPVGARVRDRIADRLEPRDRGGGGGRSERAPDSLVAALVLVDRRDDRLAV